MRFLFSFVLLITSYATVAECDNSPKNVSIDGTCTRIMTFTSEAKLTNPTLVIVLHGDSPFQPPGYQYIFAKKLALMTKNVVAVGLLRPGYTDPQNRTSGGNKGESIGDSYDIERISQIMLAVDALVERYHPSKVVLVGHSGGAAITANLIGLYPGKIDLAFIVSCPCDVSQWRKDMFALTREPVFEGDIPALSPHTLAKSVSEDTHVTLIVGSQDVVTRPYLSKQYMEQLKESGVPVVLKMVPGGHDILLNTEVLAAVASTLND